MECINLKSLLHRSKYRIEKLGEVFTPEECVEGMLSLLSKNNKNLWRDEDVIFFEPCCGYGNIVIKVLEKRLEGLYAKALVNGIKRPAHYAVANAINTLWAIDIDKKNVKQCRTRVLITVLDFLIEILDLKNCQGLIDKNKEFLSHLLCAIEWQIYQNETLSALSEKNEAFKNSCKTTEGIKWNKKQNYKSLNFKETWAEYYKRNSFYNIKPCEYMHAINYINNISLRKSTSETQFDFAYEMLEIN